MDTIIRAAAAYWFLLFTLRFVSRRAVNQMTPTELILLFLLGGMSIQAIVSDDRSITNAFLAIMTIALMHVLVSSLKQWSGWFAKVTDGTPIIILDNGNWHEDRMRTLRLQQQDVMAAARQQGLERAEQIKYAIVERNGGISIVAKN